MQRLLAAALLSSALVGPSLGFELKLYLTGTEFDGMPAFEVKFGDTVLETGTLTTISSKGEELVFDVPDEYTEQPLQVRLTNDKYEQGVGDRNLRLVKAIVGGQEILAGAFKYEQDGELQAATDGWLGSNGSVAVAAAPTSGWATRNDALGEVGGTEEAEAEVEVASELPVGDASTVVASAPVDVQAEPVCETASIAILGFPSGDLQLNDDQKTQISGFDIADNCRVSVTGFSSTSGSSSVNQRISEARAKAVADYLAEISDISSEIAVVGEGETNQFGADQGSNRRVVIEVTSATP